MHLQTGILSITTQRVDRDDFLTSWVGSARIALRHIGLLTHQDDHATRTNGVGLWTGQERLLTPDSNISRWG